MATKTDIAKVDVNLQFVHQMALVQIEVEKGVDIPAFDNSFTVSLKNVKPTAYLNLATGSNIAAEFVTSIVITMHRVEATNTYRALIPAQAITTGTEVFSFVQKTIDNTIDFSYTSEKALMLNAGKANLFHHRLETATINPNHLYAVGDIYPYKGKAQGVVYEISDGGKHGKIVGLDQKVFKWSEKNDPSITTTTNDDNGRVNMYTITSRSNWKEDYPAFAWVHSKNPANTNYNNPAATGIWYFPSKGELIAFATEFSKDKDAYNKTLESIGGLHLENAPYWSSSGYNNTNVWIVSLNRNNAPSLTTKNFLHRVRFVLAF